MKLQQVKNMLRATATLRRLGLQQVEDTARGAQAAQQQQNKLPHLVGL